jgi:undecaprenyl-diphosphatase
MSYLQAIVIALVQGFTELFPVSSLGHSVLVPAWIGGSWQTLVTQSAAGNSESSFYLAFIVALHVGTALALLWFFRSDWIRIVTGFVRSARRSIGERAFSARDSDERLAWMIVFATIPVGITGLALEHTFRTLLAKPFAAGVFLCINGLILLAGERARRRAEALGETIGTDVRAHAPIAGASPELDAQDNAAARRDAARAAALHTGQRGSRSVDELAEAYASDVRISQMPYRGALYIGLFQISALLAGISRAGVTMVGGLWRGLDHEDAARFAFLLATPVILAAGVLKLPTLFGRAGEHVHGQAAVGFVLTGLAAYVSVRFLVRYFRTRTLTPFAVYCLVAGGASVIRFGLF